MYVTPSPMDSPGSNPNEFVEVARTESRIKLIRQNLEAYFKMRERGTDLPTEVRAGVVLFVTMCYILVVNPRILAPAGMDINATGSATALVGLTTSVILGTVANLPFGVAPGMGLNTLFSYELVRQNHLSIEQALGTCFTAGCIMTLFGLTGGCSFVTRQLPLSLKKAIVVAIGLLQTLLGFATIGLIGPGTFVLLKAPSSLNADQYVSILTLCVIALMILFEVPGSILVGVILSATFSLLLGLSPLPDNMLSVPRLKLADFDFSLFYTPKGCLLCFLIFTVLFIDSGGVLIGVAAQSDQLSDEKGQCRNSNAAFVCVGVGCIIASTFGTSPVVLFLESAAAVNQGGRTGFTAIVSGLLFGVSIFFVPLVGAVPQSATAPVMILVGSFMMGAVLAIPWDRINHSLPAFITITVSAFSCSISNGIICGCCLYAVLNFPFWLAAVTGWECLDCILMLEDGLPTVMEKRMEHERQVDRKTASVVFSRHTSEVPSRIASYSGEHSEPLRQRGATGWM